jgi:hypothetical protein
VLRRRSHRWIETKSPRQFAVTDVTTRAIKIFSPSSASRSLLSGFPRAYHFVDEVPASRRIP